MVTFGTPIVHVTRTSFQGETPSFRYKSADPLCTFVHESRPNCANQTKCGPAPWERARNVCQARAPQ